MLDIVCKALAGIGLVIVGLLTAAGILRATPYYYAEIIGAILIVGGLIILCIPSNAISIDKEGR